MANLIPEESIRFSDPEDFNSQVREYVLVKQNLDSLEKRASDLREKLFSKIELSGEEDDKGNMFVELEQAVEGVFRVEKQRRVSRKLDELRAEEIITERNLEDELYKVVKVVDEDAVMAAHYEGKLTENEIDQMFPAKVVWALKTTKK